MLTTHELAHLRSLATPVTAAKDAPARRAACALAPVARLVTNLHGIETLRRSCARLSIRDGLAPCAEPSTTTLPLASISAAATGIATILGREAVTAALAFWASESDPAVWGEIAAAA